MDGPGLVTKQLFVWVKGRIMEKDLEVPEARAPVGGLDEDDAPSQGGGQQPWTAPKHLLHTGLNN